jgi:VWFA-related protein
MMNSKALWACGGLLVLAAIAQQNPGPGEVVLSSAFYRQPSRIGFETETKLVEVGAVVRDPRGQSVAGLSRDDFEIVDEGRRQQITAFTVETSAQPSEVAPVTGAPAALGKTPAAATSPATVSQRYVALIFDDLSMDHGQLVSAQAAALGFVKEGLREGDRAGLFYVGRAKRPVYRGRNYIGGCDRQDSL